jgi:endonuclease YncB( thermonuclease family)
MGSWRAGVWAASCVAGMALVFGDPGAVAQQRVVAAMPAAAAMPCGGAEMARGGAGDALDGGNFQISDGRIVHLAGIEVPMASASGKAFAGPGGAAATAALSRLISGAQVVLRQADTRSDRYGRVVAYAEAVRGGDRRSVEVDLVAAGLGRVADDAGSGACAAALLGAETAARDAKIGLWANPYYDPLRADDPASIVSERGRFALIEGDVVSVHESGATLYLNFGRRWTRDFAVTIRKRNERRFAAAGLDLKALAGRPVRVRGWVEARAASGGEGAYWRAPWIEATYPAQIQLADHD